MLGNNIGTKAAPGRAAVYFAMASRVSRGIWDRRSVATLTELIGSLGSSRFALWKCWSASPVFPS